MEKSNAIKKHLSIGLTALIGVFLLTTAFDRYHPNPLIALTEELLPSFSLDDNRVIIVAKAMTPEESKKNFKYDLLSRGVRPLHLTIQNNTSNEYSLCPSSVDLPRVEASKIALKVSLSALPRSIAYKIAGLIFWPFMIPGTIDSIRVLAHYQKLKKDLTAKSIKSEIVAPYSTFNRVLFVPEKEFQETFMVTLIELESLQPTEFLTTVLGAKSVEPNV